MLFLVLETNLMKKRETRERHRKHMIINKEKNRIDKMCEFVDKRITNK